MRARRQVALAALRGGVSTGPPVCRRRGGQALTGRKAAKLFLTRDILAVRAAQRGWSIGDHTYGQPRVRGWGNDGKLTIGRYCSIAEDVEIILGGEHRTDWVTTYPFNVVDDRAGHIKGHPTTRGDVVIGNDVWLAHRCAISSGVTIGDGAVVAGFAVVTSDVPPYAVVGGSPAKMLRYRFSEDQIVALLRIRWWDWPAEKIATHYDLLQSDRIDAFIAAAG